MLFSNWLFKLTDISLLLLRRDYLLEVLGYSVGDVAGTLHEATDLPWHFFENLFSQISPGNG